MGAFSGRLEIDDETVDEARLNGSALKTSDDAKRARLLFVVLDRFDLSAVIICVCMGLRTT